MSANGDAARPMASAAAESERGPSPGLNLLRFRPLKALFLWSGFPYVFQAGLLVCFLFLAILGWGRMAPQGVPDKLYAKTNLVNLLIWGVWWPAMVWVAVLKGRVWCAVCPLELVANATERLAQRLGIKPRKLARAIQSGALIFLFYALLQMLVAGIHLHRVPAYTSIFLWSLLLVAGLVGFFFKDRAFCRGFCPVGLLLGTYGRGALLAVRRDSPQACEACHDKPCAQAGNRNRLDGRSCPSLLNPSTLDTNTDCLVCGQCFKACQPQDNMGLYLRPPFSSADARQPLATWPVTLFVMLVSGFVGYELCSEWAAARSVYLWAPSAVIESLGLAPYEGWIKAVWMLFLVPAAVWVVLGATVLLLRGAKSMGEAWQRLALPLVVIISAAHMTKGLAKICSWGGYLPLALAHPTGVDAALAISAGELPKPGHLLPMAVVSALGVVLVGTMIAFALRESRLADAATHRSRIVAILLLGLTVVLLVLGWGFGA